MNTLESFSATELAGKYLLVVLAGEAYGIPVLNVREIIRLQKITPVPQLPPHVKGVINLRGRIIPVLDLRLAFDLPADFTERSCIVVVQSSAPAGGGVRQVGLVVDGIDAVVEVLGQDLEPPPEFGTELDANLLLGLAKAEGRVRTLLNIEQILAGKLAKFTAAC